MAESFGEVIECLSADINLDLRQNSISARVAPIVGKTAVPPVA
jgi:hypothetical protein